LLASERRPSGFLLGVAALALLVLPFITTFDDFLTSAAMRLGLDAAVQHVVPIEARLVVAILFVLQVPASSYGSQIVLHTAQYSQPLWISWNCTGWQSLLIFGGTLLVGLRGELSAAVKSQVVLIGLASIVLINLARISVVCLLAASSGYVPAVLFHDYGGTLLVISWLVVFWTLVYRFLTPTLEAT
jgi:exosortase/archaeosortase family protein